MDMQYGNYWMQGLQPPQGQQQADALEHDGQRAASAEWKEPSSSNGNGGASVQHPQSPPIDLSDFSLADFSAPQHSPSLASPGGFFNVNPNTLNNYLLSLHPSNTPTYNAVSYGNTSWSSQQTQVPLSSYSSLNGATTSASPPQISQQSSLQQAVIDPALTTMQDPPSSSLNAYSPPPNGNQMQSSQQSQPQMQRSQQSLYGQYPMMNYLGSPYLSQQQHSPTQGTLSPFALHSPSSMSIPTNQFYGTNLTPPSSSSTPAPAPPSVQSPEQTRKDQFLTSLKAALQPKEFSGARGVQHLVMLITEYGVQDVDAETRRDILTKIRDNAGNHFFRAWLENSGAMEVTREWLKAGATGTEDNQMLETIMPLLHSFAPPPSVYLRGAQALHDVFFAVLSLVGAKITDRLPFTGETLSASKIGKIVRKIAKEVPIPAVKDMASDLERKWRERFVASHAQDGQHPQPMNVDEDVVVAATTTVTVGGSGANGGSNGHVQQAKKRKSEPLASKSGPPAKKQAIASSSSAASSSSSKSAVKKEPKSSTSTSANNASLKESKTDSSFFSAPKPKPKLPSFKKAAAAPAPHPPSTSVSASAAIANGSGPTTGGPAVKKEPDPNVAQPSAIDPFQEALKDMAKGRKGSPASGPASTPPGVGTPPPPPQKGLQGKKKKSVTWPAEDQLEKVKWIERAMYDDDEGSVDGSHALHNVRDYDRDEGAALHVNSHLFEELIDFVEPSLVGFPDGLEVRPRGEESQEKVVQEQREQTALGAMYLTPQQIPDSPAEPAIQLTPEQTDENVKVMMTGPEVDGLFWTNAPSGMHEDEHMMGGAGAGAGLGAGAGGGTPSVSDLVGQLAGVGAQRPGIDLSALTQLTSMGTSLTAEQLSQLAQYITAQRQQQQQQPQAQQPNGAWDPYYAAGGQGQQAYQDAAPPTGPAGHGPGERDKRWAPPDGPAGWQNDGFGGAGRGRGGRGGGRGGARSEAHRATRSRIPCADMAISATSATSYLDGCFARTERKRDQNPKLDAAGKLLPVLDFGSDALSECA
ncbi:uncharacterized protein STEHIDRAFT_140135 [Stereum hirsutum FP-91666 SS1]|uniref:uncharacterized protein n=1 Tax=Stereum hirsutum (strain FP-91666) TaxID=721885 RepID=UPI0004449BDE|nr:uncharacterized protein STEHIDRAFT_140135 [Stereum hirsutum FP-91666 SS1]EIM85511.1 hypothetical protein STEHIDRAFT_140135 [Stereum hirsutum FP-91666 SS1]